ncbi:MAG: nuclear transport factor 2 family protein [Zetaproteobacteria bacterium]|nr:nuclear transport factor 2 family protein [Zetaproteobacteria bacterium]
MLKIYKIFALGLVSSCAKFPRPYEGIELALQQSEENAVKLEERDSSIRMDQIRYVYETFDSSTAQKAAELYANQFYFNDRIHIIQNLPNLKSYFAKQAEQCAQCRLEFTGFVQQNKDFFTHWVMHIQTNPSNPSRKYYGMSRLRFNNAGKIILHLDYWDFSELMESIPIIGRITAWFRDFLAG